MIIAKLTGLLVLLALLNQLLVDLLQDYRFLRSYALLVILTRLPLLNLQDLFALH